MAFSTLFRLGFIFGSFAWFTVTATVECFISPVHAFPRIVMCVIAGFKRGRANVMQTIKIKSAGDREESHQE
jgi:hypothetical protein